MSYQSGTTHLSVIHDSRAGTFFSSLKNEEEPLLEWPLPDLRLGKSRAGLGVMVPFADQAETPDVIAARAALAP